jgi:hypothetical protein
MALTVAGDVCGSGGGSPSTARLTMVDGACNPLGMAETVTSREIVEMLAGSADADLLRMAGNRLHHWIRSGFFAAVFCAPVNPGVGRGGVTLFPAEAKPYAALFDELADSGAAAAEISMLAIRLTQVQARTGSIARAIRGEEDLALLWRRPTSFDSTVEWLQRAAPQVLPMPVTLPAEWSSGRWVHLTRAFARARQ